MTKRILAVLLAVLALAGMFAIGASATQPELGVVIAPDSSASMARVPSCITRRAARYDAIAADADPDVQDAIFDIINPANTTTITSQFQLNRYLNAQNQAVARVLRAEGYLNWFAALWSWIQGNFWWLWAPIVAIPLLSAVGAFFTLI